MRQLLVRERSKKNFPNYISRKTQYQYAEVMTILFIEIKDPKLISRTYVSAFLFMLTFDLRYKINFYFPLV